MNKTNYIAVAAVSLDGKIARDSNHLSTEWTSSEDKVFFQYILKGMDVILVGNKTFQTAKGPLSKRNCIVLTRSVQGIKEENDHLTFFNTNQADLKKYIESKSYIKIGILGGAQVYTYCLEHDLLDELYLTIEPIVFGHGINLFESDKMETYGFKLITHKTLNDRGTILLHYIKNK